MIAVGNGRSAPRGEVPLVPLAALHDELAERVAAGARVGAMLAPRGEEIWAVLVDPSAGVMWIGRAPAEARYPTLSRRVPAVHLFERELYEDWGLVPEGHPWLKPARFSPPKGAGLPPPPTVGVTDFFRVDGDEVHEVAVGPVHAGVIEPGHFRFQCHGEHVFHLEISLGYQHRGVERALVGGPDKRSLHYAETLAGDTTIGHTTAYALVLEGLAGVEVSPRARAIRSLALELERLANHTGDLGALAGDVGFLPTASYCGRLRGDWLNLSARICGNRFGRGLVRPGGVGFDVPDGMVAGLDAAMRDLVPAANLLFDTAGVLARFEETGKVRREDAVAVGLVGPCARACGLPVDARTDLPIADPIPLATHPTGDVYARAWVRWLEVERSAASVRAALSALPGGALRVPVAPAPDRVAVSLVEGWRGEICHVGLTGADGKFEAYKVVDPSFHDWTGLALSLRDQQISDFPLCNKSFNLSYCGFDL